MSAARLAAYRALRAVDEGDDLPAALARYRDGLDDARDRALVTQLASGVLRWRAALDFGIAQAARRPTADLDPEVLTVLRLGAYQLGHLERIPAAAAVSESVRLVRRVRKSSAAGLVNAVLRALAGSSGSMGPPADPGPSGPRAEQLRHLAVAGSHPEWLVARWLDRLGYLAARRWIEFNNQVPPVTLRAQTLRQSRDELSEMLLREGVSTTPTRYAADGLEVVEGNALRTTAFERGAFHVQDEASQLVAMLAGVAPGERVLDACAAPGGKTLALDAALAGRGLLVAADHRAGRVRLLRGTLDRMVPARAVALRFDLTQALPLRQVFDCVLVDAPCSGLGGLRRDPEIRWRRTADDLQAMPATQLRMLSQAARCVTEGGRLVYATCSTEPEENQQVVEAFLARHPDFRRAAADEAGALPGELVDDGYLVTRPDRHGLDGFFGALLERGAER